MNGLDMMIAEDIRNIFMNLDELGEKHIVDGKTVICVMQDTSIMDIYNLRFLSDATLWLCVKLEDFPKAKVAGNTLRVDGVGYEVVNWTIEKNLVYIDLISKEQR